MVWSGSLSRKRKAGQTFVHSLGIADVADDFGTNPDAKHQFY